MVIKLEWTTAGIVQTVAFAALNVGVCSSLCVCVFYVC